MPVERPASFVRDPSERPIGSVGRRLRYSMALLPIVPAISIVGVVIVSSYLGLGTWDEWRWFHLFFSMLWTTATILIWRGVVTWTLGRASRTAIVAMIPFVQVSVGLPLWVHSGCMATLSDDMLRVGQHQVLAGVFIWCAIWVWWGTEKAIMISQGASRTARVRRRAVGPVARCILASIAGIPVVVGAFFIIWVAVEDVFGVSDPWLAFAPTAVVAVVMWLSIWRHELVWSRQAVLRLVAVAVVCFAAPITLCAALLETRSDMVDAVVVSLPIIGWGVWMAVALPIGRAQAAMPSHVEGEAGPRCLKCGYLLKGLTATRCPECGDEPTLDELWAASVTDL